MAPPFSGLDLPEPAPHDPARLDPEQARRCGIRPLPADQKEALDRLESDAVRAATFAVF